MQLDRYIQKIVSEVQNGVIKAREAGVDCDLPAEVYFDVGVKSDGSIVVRSDFGNKYPVVSRVKFSIPFVK